jgi:hypothetical protein
LGIVSGVVIDGTTFSMKCKAPIVSTPQQILHGADFLLSRSSETTIITHDANVTTTRQNIGTLAAIVHSKMIHRCFPLGYSPFHNEYNADRPLELGFWLSTMMTTTMILV